MSVFSDLRATAYSVYLGVCVARRFIFSLHSEGGMINHTLACTMSSPLGPGISDWLQYKRGLEANIHLHDPANNKEKRKENEDSKCN